VKRQKTDPREKEIPDQAGELPSLDSSPASRPDLHPFLLSSRKPSPPKNERGEDEEAEMQEAERSSLLFIWMGVCQVDIPQKWSYTRAIFLQII